MKKATLIFLLSTSFLLFSCNTPLSSKISTPQPTSGPISPNTTLSPQPSSIVKSSEYPVVGLKVNNSEIVLRLYANQNPKTVQNFLKKVNSGFYNGLTFHRVEPSFVVQGGDPLGNGTGGGQISSEITDKPFVRGSLGLARGDKKEISNDSQFFICLTTEACSSLTGKYVNFGEVLTGFDTLDNIKVGDQITQITTKTK